VFECLPSSALTAMTTSPAASNDLAAPSAAHRLPKQPSPALSGLEVAGPVRAALLLVNGAAAAASGILLFMLAFMMGMLALAPPAPPAEHQWEVRGLWALGIAMLAFWRVAWQLRRHRRWPWALQALALAAVAAIGLLVASRPPGIL
jgi:hypothetical protein